MIAARIPCPQEAMADMAEVMGYEEQVRRFMMPLNRYFVRRILGRGIRRGRVLDIGTGTGLLPIELAKARGTDFKILGIDISPNMIARARENASSAGLAHRIDFQVADAARLPVGDRSCDLVISSRSLHRWSAPVAVFNEVQRVVEGDGVFMIRDGRRLWGTLWGRALVWLASTLLNMSQQQRQRWIKAILAGYTIDEVRHILERSALANWRLRTDLVLFDLCIESM